jgi:hypothetical protein
MARLIGGRSKVAIRVWIDEDVVLRLGRHVEELGVSRAEFIRQCVTEALPSGEPLAGIEQVAAGDSAAMAPEEGDKAPVCVGRGKYTYGLLHTYRSMDMNVLITRRVPWNKVKGACSTPPSVCVKGR